MSEADYKALARRLSDALIKVRPLGGSELFVRVGDEFYADPDYCGRAIEKLRSDLHTAKLRLYSRPPTASPSSVETME